MFLFVHLVLSQGLAAWANVIFHLDLDVKRFPNKFIAASPSQLCTVSNPPDVVLQKVSLKGFYEKYYSKLYWKDDKKNKEKKTTTTTIATPTFDHDKINSKISRDVGTRSRRLYFCSFTNPFNRSITISAFCSFVIEPTQESVCWSFA